MTRVAVTGMGIVGPNAIGVDAFRHLLQSGRSGFGEIDRFDTSGLRSHRAALLRDFKPRDFIAPAKMRRMNALSRMGVSAARLSLDDRGGQDLDHASGLALGTCFGPVQ